MQIQKSNKGFTLIEIIVVITIVGFIILTAFSTLGRSSQQIRLQMTVEQVASNLRFDQTQVKSGKVIDGKTVCRGYKFRNGNSYSAVSADYSSGQCSSTSTLLPSLLYSVGVELNNIIVAGSVNTESELTILFEPPNGEVHFINGDGNELDVSAVDMTFVYALDDYPFDRVLSMNRAGQITYDISE